jgi:tol-pal system protein YbgF
VLLGFNSADGPDVSLGAPSPGKRWHVNLTSDCANINGAVPWSRFALSDDGATAPADDANSAAPADPVATNPVSPPPAAGDDATSEAAYRDAFALLRAGDYDRAIASFTAFQAQFPQSQYGDNAQYWLAEAYYAKAQYAQAIAEYQKMQSLYPASKKLSHALLKTGYSYDKLGKTAEANATLKALVQQYPGSAAARLGQERLAQIKSGKPR